MTNATGGTISRTTTSSSPSSSPSPSSKYGQYSVQHRVCYPLVGLCIIVYVIFFNCRLSWSIPPSIPDLDHTYTSSVRGKSIRSSSKVVNATVNSIDIDGIQPMLLPLQDRSKDHLFVHVGKAGGSSIQQMVKLARVTCEELNTEKKDNNKNTTLQRSQVCAISTIPPDRVHLRSRLHPTEWYAKYNQFFVNVRDPINRLASWYNYELTAFVKEPVWTTANKTGEASDNFRRLSKECFPGRDGFSAMVNGGLLSPKENDEKKADGVLSCNELARVCLRGDVMCYGHNYYNYETYLEEILLRKSKNKIIRMDVIRSEHSMDDFNRTVGLWTSNNAKELEEYPGVTPYVQSLYGRIRSTENYSGSKRKKKPDPKVLSPEATTALCKHICTELIVYKVTLKAADNLHSSDIRESYDALDEHCGFQVDDFCGTTWTYRDIKTQKKVFQQPW